jgi:hypothetical protein
MKVVLEPVDAPLAEYEQAWMEALGVIHRLAREKRAASPKPDGPTRT